MKRLVMMAGFVALSLLALACASESATPTSNWQLTVSAGGSEKALSLSDLEALPSEQVEHTSKETGTENSYTCVPLRTVLESAGVDLAALQSVEIEADDMFMARYGRELALEGQVYLAFRMDGGPLPDDMGTVRVIAPGQDTKLQVRYVRRIQVK